MRKLILNLLIIFFVVAGCSKVAEDVSTLQIKKTEQPSESNDEIKKSSTNETPKTEIDKPKIKSVEEDISLEYTDIDNKILTLIIKTEVGKGKFVVIDEETGIKPISWLDKRKERLCWWCNFHNQDKKIVELFFMKNKNDRQLNLKSSHEDGFIVDYGGKFKSYFKESISRESWDKLYEENPDFQYFMYLSLPVYDKSTGIVIIYQAYMKNFLWGAGYFKMYKYKNGSIEELHSMNLWIS